MCVANVLALLLLALLCSLGISGSSHFLLFANRKDIRLIDAAKPRGNSTLIIKDLEDAAALDFHFDRSLVCWTDISLEMIRCAHVNITAGTVGPKLNIVSTGLISPDGLAIDWLGNKLYWTDSETNRIEVATLEGEYRKVLFWEDLDQPRAIALYPAKGLIFWTDWGEVPKIERAGMNGDLRTRQVVIKDQIFWPNGLTLDYEEEVLYWADAKLNLICMSDLEGGKRRTVAEGGLQHPFALTLQKNTLYWTDWQTKSLHSCHKKTGANRKVILGGNLSPMDIHVFDGLRQLRIDTPCQRNNANCSHLCLAAPTPPFYTCACPTGSKLVDNFTCADGAQQVLLLARRTDLRRISLDTPDFTDVVLPLEGVRHAIAVDYDPLDKRVYWSDDEVRGLRRAFLDGTGQEDLVMTEVDHPDGIAVDWVARNLYWTDTGTDRIEVARLNGTHRKVLISEGLDEPRALSLDPGRGWMYWSDWGKEPKLERGWMDGTQRQVLVRTGLGWPNGIALDYERQILYWCDAKTDKIESINVDGTGRREVLSDNVPHIFGFTLLGNYLYWTDWQHRSIERVNKITGQERKVIIDQLPDLMGLKAVQVRIFPPGNNTCSIDNGGCTHLCLYRPAGHVCACPIGHELTTDGKTCVVPEAFLLFTRKEDIRRISLEAGHHDSVIPLSGVKEASALDFDMSDSRIYWTDTGVKAISRSFLNGSQVEAVVEFGLEFPEGMAVDWVARNLYWADMGSHRIEVARLDGSSRRVLIWKDLRNPRSIAIDPSEGYLYLGVWGAINHIERAALDGSGRTVVVNNVGRVNGLTLDLSLRRLYWADMDEQHIGAADLDGRNRHVIVKENLPQPHGLTQYQEYIYWSDWTTRSIERAHKTTGQNRSRVQGGVDYVMDLLVFHASRQNGWNPCAVNNGGCSHLCFALPSTSSSSSSSSAASGTGSSSTGTSTSSPVATPTGQANTSNMTSNSQPTFKQAYSFLCSCPTHYDLAQDNRTCVPPKAFLLFSQKNYINRLVPEVNDSPDMILPIRGLKQVRGIEFDPLNQHLYWIDGKTQTIRRAYENGTGATAWVGNPHHNAVHPWDLALEPYSRILYWTCARNNAINVTRLDSTPNALGGILGGNHAQLQDKPRSLALHPTKGWVFFTNLVNIPRIERVRLDGSGRQRLVETDLDQPSALAVDTVQDLLFWADLNLKVIEVAHLDGSNRRALISSQLSQPMSLTVHGQYVYWLERDSQLLERADKETGEDRIRVQGRIPNLSDVLSVQALDGKTIMGHPCHPSRASCSHLCFVLGELGSGTERGKCSCPPGLILAEDSKSCIDPPACGPEQFTCVAGTYKGGAPGGPSRCIPQAWRCDGVAECTDLSDEAGCPGCRDEEFRCQNGQCIGLHQQCDGVPQCSDGSDERRCCEAHQFYCAPSNLCLPEAVLCDGLAHCPDQSDEAASICLQAAGGAGLGGSVPAHVTPTESKKLTYVMSAVAGVLIVVGVAVGFVCWKKRKHSSLLGGDQDGVAFTPLPSSAVRPATAGAAAAGTRVRGQGHNSALGERSVGVGAARSSVASGNEKHAHPGMGMLGGNLPGISSDSSGQLYDRNHVTGASSSSSSGPGYPYPIETLNPPPSPATDTRSQCTEPHCCSQRHCRERDSMLYTLQPSNRQGRSTSQRSLYSAYTTLRSYRHYKVRNQPPPPTPCSTDVCDESDSNIYGSPHSTLPRMGSGPRCSGSHANGRRSCYEWAGSGTGNSRAPRPVQACSLDYDSEPFPPPPTPRSHYLSDVDASPPPSPSTSRSYFNPLPPPPSPSPQ